MTKGRWEPRSTSDGVGLRRHPDESVQPWESREVLVGHGEVMLTDHGGRTIGAPIEVVEDALGRAKAAAGSDPGIRTHERKAGLSGMVEVKVTISIGLAAYLPQVEVEQRPPSCNRHDDCYAADVKARDAGRGRPDHCHDDDCEDCHGR